MDTTNTHSPRQPISCGRGFPHFLFASAILLMVHSSSNAGPPNAAKPFDLEHRVAVDTSRLLGYPDPPSPYRTRRAFEKLKLTKPVYVLAEPGSNRLFVVEYDGRVLAFKDDEAADKTDVFLEVPDYEAYAIAVHPDYVKNGLVFVFAHGPKSRKGPPAFNRIYRYETKGEPRVCDPKTQRLIIEWASNGHSGGDLLFGPDGFLYLTSGDGTGGSDTDLTGQDLRSLCSGILRLDVDRPDPNKGYSIPKDNPYRDIEGARHEKYAIGLRNPWRMCLDPRSKTMWIGDVGQDCFEMIYPLQRGGNYGWSVYEGSHPFYLQRQLGPGKIVPPAAEHPHAEARCIIGGVFQQGPGLKDLQDTYIYGDNVTGRIWGLRHKDTKVTWHQPLARTRLQFAGFGLDHAGELLIVDYLGHLHRLEPSPAPPVVAKQTEWPRKLSQTGLFASTVEHQPHPGLIPYSVNSPLWSDRAFKERFIALPGTKTMTFTQDGPWGFPEGTVLVKTFSLEKEQGNPKTLRRVETRLLTFQEGDWQGYSYRWDDAQADAELVEAGGADREWVSTASGGGRKQTWHYPSRTECMVCHVRFGFILGINTPQLNKDHDYGSRRENQLVALTRLGVLEVPGAKGGLPKAPTAYGRLANPADASAGLDTRARSYLQANCAHCHVDEAGGNSLINLSRNAALDKMHLIGEKPKHEAFGLPDARLIAPGSPERSVLLHRVSTLQRGRMPPLATSVVDDEAVALLRAWIKELKPLPPPKK